MSYSLRQVSPHQFNIFPNIVRLSHINPLENCWRFYNLFLQEDLFGGMVLVQAWGRIGTTGQQKWTFFSDPVRAQNELIRCAHKKQRGGYQLNDEDIIFIP